MSNKRLVRERAAAEGRGNVAGRGDWTLYSQHRSRTTAAILNASPTGGRACFLGAGNCNDLDLVKLAERFSELHLVDIDGKALASAKARQPAHVRPKIHLHEGIELTGLLARLSDVRRPVSAISTIEAALAPATESILAKLPSNLDLAVSCCVTTQLCWAIQRAVSAGDPMLLSLQHAAMVIHLRTLAGLLVANRTALLVTDAISTETYPLDGLPRDQEFLPLVSELADKTVLFEPANPIVLKRAMRRDAKLRESLRSPTLTDAWLWTGPLERLYLVYAMSITRT